METEQVIQGRRVGPEEIRMVRHYLVTERGWNRTRLSRELCLRWDWRNATGRLKDMACRSLLLKLQRRGLIRLPKAEGSSYNGLRNRKRIELPHDSTPIHSGLSRLQPLRIEALGERHADLALFRFFLQRHHYLGYGNSVGENLKYMVRDRCGRPLACVLFGAAAWKAKPRDLFIGWDAQERQRHLGRLANNTRFLILPWVSVPHLASHLLARVASRINADWMVKYGHGIEVLETFVERDRFRGTCYRAAGWLRVGATTGRSRNDVDQTLRVPIKDIYLLPLRSDFRGRLRASACSLPEGRAGR